MSQSREEGDFQVSLCRWLKLVLPRGSQVVAVFNEFFVGNKDENGKWVREHRREMAAQSRRKAMGLCEGAMDLLILLPRGQCYLLECKKPGGGELRSDQQDFRRAVLAIAHDYGVADSIETARYALLNAGISLREAPGQLALPWMERLAKPRAKLPADTMPF